MRRLPFLYLLAPLAAMILVLGVACGDDDDDKDGGDGGGEQLTLEEYFTKVETLSAKFDEDRVALQEKYPEAFDSVDQTRSLFAEAAPLLKSLAEDLGAINPPSEAKEVHTRTVNAANQSATFLENTAVVLEDVQTDKELDEAVENSTSLTQTLQRLQDACLDGQALADRESIDVDLKCPTDEENPTN